MKTKQQVLEWLEQFPDTTRFAIDECGYLAAINDGQARWFDVGAGPDDWCSECSADKGHLPGCQLPIDYGRGEETT